MDQSRQSGRELRRAVTLTVLALAVAVAPSCGRKDRPLPPIVRVAEQTRDLEVLQEGREAILNWTYPSMTTAGGSLADLEAVEVWRATLPLGQEPTGTSVREVEVKVRLLEAQGEILDTLDRVGIDAATRGPLLSFRDDLQRWHERYGARDAPQVVWYSVRSICCRGRESRFSNIARLVPQLPPEPPEGLQLEPSASGIGLTWHAPDGQAVMVERSPDGASWQTVTADTEADGEWHDGDVTQGRRWWYRLRAVSSGADGAPVLSEPGEPAVIDYRDVYPPAMPANFVCLPEGGRIILRWDEIENAEAYRIFRSSTGQERESLGPALPGTLFADDDPPAGTVVYAVRSVDGVGNESPDATCTTVVGPPP